MLGKVQRVIRDPVLLRRPFKRNWRIIRRFFDVGLMMIFLQLWPEQLYRFSTKKLLAPREDRYPPPLLPQIPYELIHSRTSQDLPEFGDINLVMRGSSFNMKHLDNLTDPVVFVSFWPKAMWPNPYKNEFWPPIKTERRAIYSHFHSGAVRELLALGLEVLWIERCYEENGRFRPDDGNRDESWYEELITHPLCRRISMKQTMEKGGEPSRLRPPMGSGLSAVSAMSFIADTINIYGWDYYLGSTPKEMGYWELTSKLYHYSQDMHAGRNSIEIATINFYYGYQLSKIDRINNHGYLGQLQHHSKLIEKLERVLFFPKRGSIK